MKKIKPNYTTIQIDTTLHQEKYLCVQKIVELLLQMSFSRARPDDEEDQYKVLPEDICATISPDSAARDSALQDECREESCEIEELSSTLDPSSSPDEKLMKNNPRLKDIALIIMRAARNAPDGVVDLRDIMAMFNSSKKRRIYDVTNVMEGVDIIEKLQNAQIKWQCAEISNANINSKFKMYLEENSAMKDELNQKLNYLQKYSVNFLLDNYSIDDLKKSATKQNLSLEFSDTESTYTCTKNDSLQNFNFEITHR